MTDRELLELAAKAAGIAWLKYVNDVTDYDSQHYGGPALQLSSSAFTWNPLTDDGDALRLAVRLRIDLHFEDQQAWAGEIIEAYGPEANGSRRGATEALEKDAASATRRAIVRAAAEIGKAI